jgi:hypothetical protein
MNIALNTRLAHMTSWEFAMNLLLDKPHLTTGMALRDILMSISSSVLQGTSVFHTIDKSWRDDNGVFFSFIPENESDGRMHIARLVLYLRSINPWYLLCFTEDARNRHRTSHWDPKSKQMFSTDELEIANNL